MSPKREDGELRRELDYYKRRVDELAGENLKLDYMISGLRHELKQKRQGFALLSELHQSVGAEQISAIFEVTIEAINATLGMDRTVVLVPAETEHAYRPTHWLGFREEATREFASLSLQFPPEFATGTGLLLVHKGSDMTELTERIRTAFDLPYFICVPVPGEHGPIGLLLSGRLKEVRPLYPPLDQGDTDTFQAIAGLISASISNMRVAVLEEMDRLKTDFFANISHEFRTPITLTVGPLEQLLAGRYGDLPPSVVTQLRIMRRNQERLLGLVNQILDLSKMEAGGMELRAARVPHVNDFFRDRIEAFRAVANERGIELRTALDARAAHATLYLDPDKIDKLLFNLLSNALKFTREGWVEVATEVRDTSFRLTVTDTGVGIKEDQLPHIFDRFRQADGSESREFAGTGIGLALVKEIAHLHGGDVQVFSQYGKGTSFHVTVPLGIDHLNPESIVDFIDEPASESDNAGGGGSQAAVALVGREGARDRASAADLNEATEKAFDPKKPSVVYAEDNPDLRRHVHDLLSGEFNLFLAVDGREGLELVRRYQPDLVISDQMMPNLSGRELLHAIREDDSLHFTPVIFLTARVGTDARIASLEAGADDYLTKPFHHGELLARARNLIRARRQERELADLNRRLENRIDEQMGELLRTGQLKRFLPPAVAEQLIRGDLDAGQSLQRKRVTILVARVPELEKIGEGLEPEDLTELVNGILREVTAGGVSEGATVEASAIGDLTAIFGAPTEMEPVEQGMAAARAALRMRSAIDELGMEWRRRGISDVPRIRVGVATGYATVGVFGSDLQRTYTAVGTPRTIASRLAVHAGAGEVLFAAASHGLIGSLVRSAPRGEYEIEGVARPIDVFELLAVVDDDEETRKRFDTPAPVFLPK